MYSALSSSASCGHWSQPGLECFKTSTCAAFHGVYPWCLIQDIHSVLRVVIICHWLWLCFRPFGDAHTYVHGAQNAHILPRLSLVNGERRISSACPFAKGGNSRLVFPRVPTRLVSLACKTVDRLRKVKKLSVVKFLPFPGTPPPVSVPHSLPRADLCSASPPFRYRAPFNMYFDWTSAASQNLMPNLSGLFPMYCVNLHRALVGNNCSSTVMLAPGL